ncbi:hypothetical protein FNT36_06165 [Hymenobacter setariae]|uniref:Uncharacterized protein n=1 Tax=Hymenobacter setariae TaxID=2594794 RepID=A0A558C4I5_9BACT|nr:hypothetical protein [Hymenobacter setariae]TVT43666.1 hypothetical protein FNT36_06165 [Hymenobacter setariae]
MPDTKSKNTVAAAQPKANTTPKATGPAKPKPKPKKDEVRPLQPLHSYSGRVGAFGANPDGVLDRFQLETADRTHTVKFPPHFGQELRTLAQPGHEVAVLGFLETTPKGDEHLHLVRLDAAEATARPLPPTPPAAPSAADAPTISGPVAELKLDPKGRLRALLLEGDGTELRLPPHIGEQLAARLAVGAAVVASGQRRTLRPGEVLAHPEVPAPLTVELLTVGAESFLLR